MTKDWVFSIALHALIVAATLLGTPFEIRRPRDFGEVIRINAVTMADVTPSQPEPMRPLEVPQALEAEMPEIPIDEPTSKPAAQIDKPADKPQPKPPQQKPATTAAMSDKTQIGAENGQADIEAPAGTSISGVSVDNASFNYPYWFTLAWSKINQHFRVPVAIDGRVYCDVYFQVIKSGRVIELKVVSASGISPFDDACLAAIERAAPFPPLPREFVDEIIGITITFTN
jgi:protein TonB